MKPIKNRHLAISPSFPSCLYKAPAPLSLFSYLSASAMAEAKPATAVTKAAAPRKARRPSHPPYLEVIKTQLQSVALLFDFIRNCSLF